MNTQTQTPHQHATMPRSLWWLLAGVTFAWGFNWTAMKVGLAEFPPWNFRVLCLGFGAVLLMACARLAGESLRVPAGMWPRLWLLSFFNVSCWNMLIAYGVMMIPSGRAAILAFTMPLWSIPLSVWLLHERITARKLVALGMGMAGMVLLVSEDFDTLGEAPVGALLAIGAAITWAIGTVLQKRLPTGMGTVSYSAWTMLLGGVPILVGALLLEADAWAPVSALAVAGLAYNIVIAFAFAYWAWFKIVAVVPVAVSSISVLAVPIVGVVSGVLFLGERPGVQEICALLLVTGAVLVVNLPGRGKD